MPALPGLEGININSLKKVVLKQLLRVYTEDFLNYDMQKKNGKIPAEWTLIDVFRPVPLLMNKLCLLYGTRSNVKEFYIYAENYLMMLSRQ